LKLKFTNNYSLHYEKTTASGLSEEEETEIFEGFRVVLPVSEITVAAFFDVDAYVAIQDNMNITCSV
jgi:hypothetical protein